MITIATHISLVGVLLSTTSSSEVTYEGSSKITVNENFKEPIVLPPGYPEVPTAINNFIHQGTNFFFNPQFLLGGQVPPPIRAVIASTKPDSERTLFEQNIKVPIDDKKTVEVTINEKFDPPPITETPIQITAPTVEVDVNNIVPVESIIEESIEEVTEPHDIIMINKDLQPVLKPEIIVTQQLLTVPEAPVLPPLVLPEPQVKMKIEESIPLSVDLPAISESELYIPLNPNIPLLIESNNYRPLITEIDYKLNEIPTAPELPPLLLNKFPQLIPTFKNKTVVLLPTPPYIPSSFGSNYPSQVVQINIPYPAVYAHNIVEERVIPNMFKIDKKTTTKTVEILSFPIFFNTPVHTSAIP